MNMIHNSKTNKSSYMPTFIFLIMMSINIVMCKQFHVAYTVTRSIYDNNVKEIFCVSGQRLAVISLKYNQQWDVTMYQGPQYKNYINYFTIPKNTSFMISANQIITWTQSSIKTAQNTKIQVYSVKNGIFSSKMAISQKYALVSQKIQCPNLYYVDLKNGINSSKVYQQGTQCKFNNVGLTQNIGNGYVAYAAKYNLYFIDQLTLEKMEKFDDSTTQFMGNNGYTYINSWASASNDSTVLLTGQTYYSRTFSYNSQLRKYEKNCQFYNPTSSNIKLTGIDTGVSFWNTNMYKWRNIKKHILSFQSKNQSQHLRNHRAVGQFIKQTKFLSTNSSYNLSIYSLQTQTYTITLQKTISLVGYAGYINPNGYMTSDNRLFLSTSQIAGWNKLISVDLISQTITMAKSNVSGDINCGTFGMLNNQQVVAVCTIDKDYAPYQYQIQVRDTGSMEIVSQVVKLSYIKILPQVRIITSVQWDNYFILLIKKQYDNCTAYVYKLQGGAITNTTITSDNISFSNSYAWGKNIASIKYIASSYDIPEQNYMKIFRPQDLTLLNKFYIKQAIQRQLCQITINQNILIVQTYPKISGGLGYVYDYNYDGMYRGAFFKMHNTQVQKVVFAEQGIMYVFSKEDYGLPYKVVYDVMQPPIVSVSAIFNRYVKVAAYLYVTVQEIGPKTKQTCPLIFFVINTTLYKLRECPQPQQPQTFSLDPTGKVTQFQNDVKLYLASDKQNIILTYYPVLSTCILQIRNLYTPNYILWQSIQKLNYIQNADIIPISNFLIYTTSFSMKMVNLYPIIYPYSYQITKFIHYITNDRGCKLIVGPSINDPQNTMIVTYIYANNQDKKYKLVLKNGENIKLLALHPQCNGYFAMYVQRKDEKEVNKTVEVYRVESNGTVDEIVRWNITEVVDIKMVKNKIFIKTNSGIIVKDIQMNNLEQQQQMMLVSENQKYCVSADGKYVAQTINLKQVKLTNILTKQLIDTYPIPQEGSTETIITAIAFNQQNKLFITTNNSQLILLSSQPCPANLILDNFLCVCPATFIYRQNQNRCVCPYEKYYQKQNSICSICQAGNYIDQKQQQCLKCGFMCKECVNNESNCMSISVGFILLIVSIVVVVLVGVGVGMFLYMRKKKRNNARNQQVDRDSGLLTGNKTGYQDE